ncbi:MAG: hypothetical protein GWP91_01685 [Rhodobacterales bacterium]|nr:hypothetical protein [Rhodobacterales bacterium]
MSKIPSVLDPPRGSLLPGLGCSIFVHGTLVVSAGIFSLFMQHCGPSKPVLDLDRTMEVSMMVLPKSKTNVPERASRAPTPQGSKSEAPKTEAPPNPSDLVIHTENAPEDNGEDGELRDQMMAKLERQRLLEDLMAPEGSVDRDASDPNSTSDVAINANGAAMRGDPEFAAYIAMIQQLFQQNFKPLGAITAANPDLLTKIFITVDPSSGRILSSTVEQSSGIPAYDAAAERAVSAITTVPLPPEKFSALLAEGYLVNFTPPN